MIELGPPLVPCPREWAAFVPPQRVESSATPLSAPFWQPSLLVQLNNLIDTDPNDPSLCARSWVATGQTLPGTVPFRSSDAPVVGAEASADGWPAGAAAFEEGAGWLESLRGNLTECRRQCVSRGDDNHGDEEETGGVMAGHGAGCDVGNEICLGMRRERGFNFNVADGTTLGIPNYPDFRGTNLPLWISSRPRVIVRDAEGQPLSGRYPRTTILNLTPIESDSTAQGSALVHFDSGPRKPHHLPSPTAGTALCARYSRRQRLRSRPWGLTTPAAPRTRTA